MPRAKSWSPRVLHILKQLEADTAEHYHRRNVEQLFSVSASQAKELMSVAGAKVAGPGLDATVTRRKLIDYLKYSREGQDAVQEQERRHKLAERIRAEDDDLKLHRAVIGSETAPYASRERRFSDLPNVRLEPGRMVIVYQGKEDLLHQLIMLSRAMLNEPEILDQLTEPQEAAS